MDGGNLGAQAPEVGDEKAARGQGQRCELGSWAPFEVPAPGTRSQSYLIRNKPRACRECHPGVSSFGSQMCLFPGCHCEQATKAGLVKYGQ